MPLHITEEMVLNYIFGGIDLPKGVRLVSVTFEPRTRKVHACKLEKDGQALKIGDSLPDDGRVIRFPTA